MARKYSKGSKVIDMLDSRTAQARFRAAPLLEAYWQALVEGADIPRRSQLDPRAMEPVLEYAFILERIAPGICRFRLAGRHLNDLMGQEVRGMPITAMFEPGARKTVSQMIEQTCTQGHLVEAQLAAESGFGRGPLQARMFLAPLRDDNGQVTRIVGCLESLGKIGRQPRRFTISKTRAKSGNVKVPPLDMGTGSGQRMEFAESQVPFTPKASVTPTGEPAPPSKTLRLVVDNS